MSVEIEATRIAKSSEKRLIYAGYSMGNENYRILQNEKGSKRTLQDIRSILAINF